jgi:hypothetical protein
MSAWNANIVRVDIPGKPDAEEYVRELSGKDIERVMNAFPEGQSDQDAMIEACLLFCCDKDGVSLFTDDDRDKVASAPVATIIAVAEKAMEINGLSEAEEDLAPGQ